MGDVLTNRHRFAVVAAIEATLGIGLFACAGILGIEDKPLRVEPDTSKLADGTVATDAGAEAMCDPTTTAGCSAACPHDFCDDFDGDGQAPATRWQPPSSFSNPFLQGDSGLSLTTPGNSSQTALFATASSSLPQAFSLLVEHLMFGQRHGGKTFDGVRVAMDLFVDALSFTDVGGPVEGVGSGAVLGLLRPDSLPPKGVGVVLTTNSAHLNVSEDALNGKGAQLVGDINPNLKVANVLNRWVRVELFVGDRDRAVREKYTPCSTLAPGLVAAATLGGKILGEACLPISEGFGPAAWAETPALVVGGLLYAPGEAALRIDNVMVDFYVK